MSTGIKRGKRRVVALSLELDWPYKHHMGVFAGIQQYAAAAGWVSTIDPFAHLALKPGSGRPPYDGVIARATPTLAAAARRVGVPVVNVWMNSPARGLPAVFPDCAAAGTLAAEHLIGRGFRRFGFLGYTRNPSSRLQCEGFEAALRRHGFRCTAHRFSHNITSAGPDRWAAFLAGLESWIDSWDPPVGLYVTEDLVCRYLIQACRAKELRVPQDVAVVGSSNEEAICDSPPPTLTSIEYGYALVGFRAAALLERLMDGSPPPTEPELVPPAELIPRQSTDFYAADDPVVARALHFMADNGHRRIQVKDVAVAVLMSRRTLERRFAESLGRSIADELTRLRLERAKRLMVETDAPLASIAFDSGFRDANHLSKVFIRVEGAAPSHFREEHQRLFHRRIG